MTEKEQLLKKISLLEQELHTVKEENEILTSKAEDFLLLGIISEKINLANTIEDVIDITLESISSLKDIHYSSYLKYSGEKVEVIYDYTSLLSASYKGKSYKINDAIQSALQEENFLFECVPNSLPPFIPNSLRQKIPNGYCLFPVDSLDESGCSYLFLFVFFSQDLNEMQSMLPLLCRGLDMACAKIESLNLLQKINSLNSELASKVEDQAKEYIKTSALLTSLVDSIPDLIFYKNLESVYLGCNNAFCEFAGRSKKQIIGYTDYDLFDRNLANFFREKDRQMLQKGKPARNEEWVKYPDGKEVLLDTLKTPYYGPKNEVLGLIGISRDITDKKKTEEELLKVKKIESVGVLAGGIAHDFNNILAAILGNINLALFENNLEKETKKLLSEAEKATLRAKNLTQQLLTFSKGGIPVKETASLETVIKESANFVLHGEKVACEYNIPKDLWFVDIDKGQIGQVIQNMVLNATQAMPDGGIIKISCKNIPFVDEYILPDEVERKCVKITITDSGIGIAENMLDRIFDPYFSTKQKGSGLGLAICLSIIKKHSGTIIANSSSAGTSFDIYLPVSRKILHQKENTTIEDHKTFNKARILIMDDEKMIRDVAKAMLTRLGTEIALSKDGADAINEYKEAINTQKPFDAVIMDLTIPGGMGGREAVKEIHKINPEAKVIVSSGYSNDPVMANFKSYGFCAAIVKPFQLQDLSRVLSQVLG